MAGREPPGPPSCLSGAAIYSTGESGASRLGTSPGALAPRHRLDHPLARDAHARCAGGSP